jgi:hypothetical protein
MKWLPIEELPKDIAMRVMFVVKGFCVKGYASGPYDTDPYCVWLSDDGESFVRWPHQFAPTHFCLLPEKE